jgi:hypothetical protein
VYVKAELDSNVEMFDVKIFDFMFLAGLGASILKYMRYGTEEASWCSSCPAM